MFKANDVRGTTPDLDAKFYYLAGKGLMEKVFLAEKISSKIIITHDCRLSSPEFYKALVAGIIDGGGQPVCLGLGSTDFLYAATQLLNLPGANITASHNPKNDNGMKIVKSGSTILSLENGLEKVRDFVFKNQDTEVLTSNFKNPTQDLEIKYKVTDYFKSKIYQIGEIFEVDSILKKKGLQLKIAVDCGNGMGGFVMQILKNMYKNIEFKEMYWELDGNYPNHPADPQNFDNLKDLQQAVKSDPEVAFGFAFDGDADRVFFVDDKAEIVQGDFLVAFFAQTLLNSYFNSDKKDLNPAIVYVQPGSLCVPEAIAYSGGIAIPAKQGHTFIKALMEKYRAVYGGEFSGHHYFAEFNNMDSGVLAAVLMIKILVKSNLKLSEIFQKLKQNYFISPLISIKLKAGQTFDDIKPRLKNHFADAVFSEMDGLSVFYPDWKFSIRPSNTEPVLKMILETRHQNFVNQKLSEIMKLIEIS